MLRWDATMETKVATVDAQHKELVRQVNGLLDAMKAGKGKDVVADVLVFLGKYAVEHFGMEETLMKRHNYPDFQKHKAIHEAFKKDFGALAKNLDGSGAQGSLATIEVQRRVIDWLKSHILSVDQELGKFLVAKGVTA